MKIKKSPRLVLRELLNPKNEKTHQQRGVSAVKSPPETLI